MKVHINYAGRLTIINFMGDPDKLKDAHETDDLFLQLSQLDDVKWTGERVSGKWVICRDGKQIAFATRRKLTLALHDAGYGVTSLVR